PGAGGGLGAEGRVAVSEQHQGGVGVVVRCHKVELAVAVQVPDRHRIGAVPVERATTGASRQPALTVRTDDAVDAAARGPGGDRGRKERIAGATGKAKAADRGTSM